MTTLNVPLDLHTLDDIMWTTSLFLLVSSAVVQRPRTGTQEDCGWQHSWMIMQTGLPRDQDQCSKGQPGSTCILPITSSLISLGSACYMLCIAAVTIPSGSRGREMGLCEKAQPTAVSCLSSRLLGSSSTGGDSTTRHQGDISCPRRPMSPLTLLSP